MKNDTMFAKSVDIPHTESNGISTHIKIAFDKEKIEEKKGEIASILQKLGIDDNAMIQLSNLTTLKSGETWNEVKSLEDFQALELLLACSDACGFIINNDATKQLNINEIGESNSILISEWGKSSSLNEDNWLENIRKFVIPKMHFIVKPDEIKKFASQYHQLTSQQPQEDAEEKLSEDELKGLELSEPALNFLNSLAQCTPEEIAQKKAIQL